MLRFFPIRNTNEHGVSSGDICFGYAPSYARRYRIKRLKSNDECNRPTNRFVTAAMRLHVNISRLYRNLICFGVSLWCALNLTVHTFQLGARRSYGKHAYKVSYRFDAIG